MLLIDCASLKSFGDGPDPAATIASVIERQRRLQNLVVEYDQTKSYTPKIRTAKKPLDDPFREVQEREAPIEGTSRNKCLFRYLDRQLRYECEMVEGQGTASAGMQREVSVFSRDRIERLWRQRHQSFDEGLIHAEHPLPDDAIVDFVLGLRAHDDLGWLRYEDWKKAAVKRSGKFVEIERRETKRPVLHVWTADPEKGYAFVQYRIIYKGRVSELGVAEDFREVDGLQLPYAIVWKQFGPDGPDSGPVYSAKLKTDRYQINSPDNTVERFLIEWPNKSVVLDTRSGDMIVVRDGPRVLDEAYLQSRAKNRTPRKRAAREQRSK